MKQKKLPEKQTTIDSKESPIKLTDAAAKKIYELLCTEGNFSLKLRLYIVGGGCAGFEYGFAFDKNVNSDEDVIVNKVVQNITGNNTTVSLIIDAMSLQYLNGATVNYMEDLRGSHFTVINPNATITCGCGSSFSIDD